MAKSCLSSTFGETTESAGDLRFEQGREVKLQDSPVYREFSKHVVTRR